MILRVLAFACVMLAVGAAHSADLTRTYSEAQHNNCSFGTAHVDLLRKHKILLVPGYFSDIDPSYFSDQLQWLASLSVEREKVAVESRQSVAVNAPIIAAAIRTAKLPVILITHSKGSVDALEAMRTEPALHTKVKGWVSLQGAFHGSPVADMLLDEQRFNPLLAALILGLLGGTKESAHGLTTGAARAYLKTHAAAISALVRTVPAVAFASALDGAEAKSRLELPRQMMWRAGIRNDGLIPLDAAVLPGMDFVKITGVDHIAPVMRAELPFDRVRMTKALLLALRTPFRDLPRDAACVDDRRR